MATDKETIILDFQVEQGSAIAELERTKKSIVQLKQEQQELNKAYKAGDVTIEEYASESVRLEGILKKQQSTYTNVQKSVTGVKTKMDDLIASNNKLADSVKTSTENIRVGGVTVGELGTRLTALANPVTAAVAVVGALGAAYARSTIGAKDLEFASNQLSAATTILTNNFASLISSAEDGQGALSKISNSIISIIFDTFRSEGVESIAEQSNKIALAAEKLQDLQREEISIRATVGDRLADNQELLTKIQDSQTDYNEKTHLTSEIISNLTKNEDELLAIKKKQLAVVQTQLDGDKENETLQTAVLQIEREISNISKDAERKRQGILRLESNLKDTEEKRLDTIRKQNQALNEQAKIDVLREEFKKKEESDAKLRAERDKQTESSATEALVPGAGNLPDLSKKELKLVQKTESQKRDEYIETANLKRQLEEDNTAFALEQLHINAENALVAFGEQSALFKVLASAETLISTYSAAQKSYDALAGVPYVGPVLGAAAAAVAIASGLARVAAINSIDVAAAGGADFVTNRPTMLLVGDNPGNRERVTVEPLSGRGQTRVFNGGSMIAAAGGLGNIDGGAAKNSAVRETNQAILMANAIKAMPRPIVSWIEGRAVGRNVEFKERLSKK